MNIKIQCRCGTKFAFDVEPVDGRMPAAVQCPVCGADGTEDANAAIHAQSAPVRVRVASPASEPAGEASISSPPLSGAENQEDAVVRCSKHPREVAAAECAVCHKPICSLCLDHYGFLCSVYCKEQAESRGIPVPAYKGQKRLRESKEGRKTTLLVFAVTAALLGLVMLWMYYAFVGSKPHPAFVLKADAGEQFLQTRWVGRERVAVLSGLKLVLLDARNGQEIWRSALKADEQVRSRSTDRGEQDVEALSWLEVSGDDLWAVLPARALRYDLRTGKREQEFPLPQPVERITPGRASLLVTSTAAANDAVLTRLDLISRQAPSETVRLPAPPKGDLLSIGTRPAPVLRAGDSVRVANENDQDDQVYLRDNVTEFIPAGPAVVQLSIKLLKPNVVPRATAQAESTSVLDSSNLRAGDSSAATKEFLRGSQGAAAGRVDESAYRVSLRRLFGGGLESWSSDLNGPPVFFALNSVDLLTAGNTLIVFSKSGQKQWEAKLGYPISPRFTGESAPTLDAPGFDAGGRLFFFDQGMLTVFDLKNGQVKWRLNSVGISQAELGSNGRLCLSSTTAGPQSIPSAREIVPKGEILPVLICVDAESGKVLWQKDRLGEQLHVSGDFIYGSRAQISGVDLFVAATEDSKAPVHHRIWRLDPKSGRDLWEFYRPKAPLSIRAMNNHLLLHYSREVEVLSFWSL